jgi:hypothetical protein
LHRPRKIVAYVPAVAVCRAMFPNVLFAAVPMAVIATRQTTTIRASITAYSTAVGPSSALTNSTSRKSHFRMGSIPSLKEVTWACPPPAKPPAAFTAFRAKPQPFLHPSLGGFPVRLRQKPRLHVAPSQIAFFQKFGILGKMPILGKNGGRGICCFPDNNDPGPPGHFPACWPGGRLIVTS